MILFLTFYSGKPTPKLMAMDPAIVLAFIDFLKHDCRSDVNLTTPSGKTALMFGAESGNGGVVQSLCKRKDIEINMKDTSGATALIAAAKTSNECNEAVQHLCAHKDIDPNLQGTLTYTAAT